MEPLGESNQFLSEAIAIHRVQIELVVIQGRDPIEMSEAVVSIVNILGTIRNSLRNSIDFHWGSIEILM